MKISLEEEEIFLSHKKHDVCFKINLTLIAQINIAKTAKKLIILRMSVDMQIVA